MKLLLVSHDEQLAGDIYRYFTPRGYSVIHYSNPLKAMDNFREIRPDIIIFHEPDFPRHWKLSVQSLRELYSRDTALFILMVPPDYPEEDLHKAYILGVNGILKKKESEKTAVESLESLILYYKPSPEVRKQRRLLPLGEKTMDFIFMNPENLQLINARVLELSEYGAIVKPVEEIKTEGLIPGMEISNCSLKTGDVILSISVRIIAVKGVLELEFIEGLEDWKSRLKKSIESYN